MEKQGLCLFILNRKDLPINQRGPSKVDIATGGSEGTIKTLDDFKSAAALLWCKGGLKGVNARVETLTAKKRSEIVIVKQTVLEIKFLTLKHRLCNFKFSYFSYVASDTCSNKI